jgi:N-acetylmuramoyl-L-alanine amidase
MFMKKRSVIYSILILSIILSPILSVQAATPLELINKYKTAVQTGKKVNVLIVPGHDDQYWGTEFGEFREADINVAIGQYLFDYLKNDPRLNVQITRTQMGYTDTFNNYFATNQEAIQQFIRNSKEVHQSKVSSGQIQQIENVPHNNAQPEVALRLFGINKWANENNIDIILHLHINDQGGRQWNRKGEYVGIAVYIPERQFNHAPASAVLGEAIFNELKLKNVVSTYPAESAGLIEEQDLIAIGTSNTLKSAAAALIEYGYIYEPKFQNLAIQETVTKDLAYQTYLGLHRFFGDRDNPTYTPAKTSPQGKSFLPFTWKKDLQKLMENVDVSALQAALTQEGVYNCGVIGLYGPCTERGVKAFQKKYGISQTGVVGPLTRAKLNQLFSR